jgi:hypothetical protein
MRPAKVEPGKTGIPKRAPELSDVAQCDRDSVTPSPLGTS